MDLRLIYEQIQGDYENVIGRLMKEERVVKYLVKFANSNTLGLIKEALEREDYEEAFRETHSLKGICANLSMDKLGRSASELTEALRGGKPKVDISPLLEAVEKDYEMTLAGLKNL